MTDKSAGKAESEDAKFKSALEEAATQLGKDAGVDGLPGKLPAFDEIRNEMARQEGYRKALSSEFDAEASFRRVFPGQASVNLDKLASSLKNPELDPKDRGYLQFLQDNFDKIAGVGSRKSEKTADLTVQDVRAMAAMNETNPQFVSAGLAFLSKNFFQVSDSDGKVNAERVERLLHDHSYLLFPKETQEGLLNLGAAMKGVELHPANYEKGRRIKFALTAEDAEKLDAAELVDNLRIQALQKVMFGRQTQKLDKKSMSPEAEKQYKEAAAKYVQLKAAGLNEFLEKLEKQ